MSGATRTVIVTAALHGLAVTTGGHGSELVQDAVRAVLIRVSLRHPHWGPFAVEVQGDGRLLIEYEKDTSNEEAWRAIYPVVQRALVYGSVDGFGLAAALRERGIKGTRVLDHHPIDDVA